MDHGCFSVQMEGEAFVVPANSPHAVFALKSDYIVGQTFTTNPGPFVLDLCTIKADVAGGNAVEEACESRVKQLRGGLSDKRFRQTYVGQFIETWLADAEVLPGNRFLDD